MFFESGAAVRHDAVHAEKCAKNLKKGGIPTATALVVPEPLRGKANLTAEQYAEGQPSSKDE
jgi:hypothetical protein